GLVYIPSTTAGSSTFAAAPAFAPEPNRQDGFTGVLYPARRATGQSPPDIRPDPPSEPGGGRALVAWDPAARRIRWRAIGSGPTRGGPEIYSFSLNGNPSLSEHDPAGRRPEAAPRRPASAAAAALASLSGARSRQRRRLSRLPAARAAGVVLHRLSGRRPLP